ncbi:MAG: hypothetical protein IPJ03_17845 [Ignavibacteriales bacterium]|nr:hypothetical protein [Ignavibacteriales bacterium]
MTKKLEKIQDGVFEQLQELALTKQELIKHTSLKYKDVLGEINKVLLKLKDCPLTKNNYHL